MRIIYYLLVIILTMTSFLMVDFASGTACAPCDCAPGVGGCAADCESDEECQGDTTPGDGTRSGSCINPSSITVCPAGSNKSFSDVLEAVLNFVFWLGMAIFPLMCVFSGILFLISAGNPQKVEQAKKMLFWAIIGIAVLLCAKGIASLIRSVIGL